MFERGFAPEVDPCLIYNHMVVDLRERPVDERRADEIFHALADATRRDIVRQAMRGEHSVSALARRYPISLPAVQKHVATLAQAGLVTKRRRGREQIVRTDIDTIRIASALLDQFEVVWRDRLQRFGDVLAEPDEREHP